MLLGILILQMGFAAGQNLNGRVIRHLTFRSDGMIRKIGRADLEKLVVLKEGEKFTDSKSRATVIQLLATDLFWNAEVHVEPVDESTVDVQIVLIRLYEVSRIEFDGDVQLSDHRLLRELDIREGEPYSDAALERSVTRLKTVYQQNGFYQSQIKPTFKLDEKGRPLISVTFSIQAGEQAKVAHLTLDVENPPSSEELRKEMKTQEGKPFSRERLDADLDSIRTRLALDGYFHPEIYIRDGVQYDEESNTVSLEVRIVPREHTEVRWIGLDPKPSELRDLPLYSNAGPRRLLLEETVDTLTQRFEGEGYFRAEVSYEATGPGFPPEHVTIKVTRGQKYDLSKVRFEGNESVPSETLQNALVSETAGILSRGNVTDDTIGKDTDNLRAMYQHRGYLDVSVHHHFEEDGGNLTLVYRIEEGPQYHVGPVTLSGNSQLSREQLLRNTSLKQGEVFSPYLLASDRSQIQAEYETRGFRSAEVESSITHQPDHIVSVQYTIAEGPKFFTKYLLIAGNELTKRKLIDQEILVEPGEPLSYEKLLQSETNLYNLAVFNRVKMKELPTYESTTEKSALFSLDEAKKYSLIYGLGYSHSFGSTASEGLRGTLGITNTNFQGMARVLSLSLRAGRRRQRGNVTYTLPRLIGKETPLVLSFAVDNERRIEGSQSTVLIRGRPYDSFRVISSLQAERSLSRRESLFFRYNFEGLRLSLPPESDLPPAFFREEQNLILSKISLSYLNDSRDQQEEPTTGFFLNGEATLAARPIGSQRQFAKMFAQGRYYFPLYSDLTFVTALRLGVIEPFGAPPPPDANGHPTSSVPISERFFAGGPSTLRGVPIDLAGPLLLKDNGEPALVPTHPQQGQKQVPVPLGGNALVVGNAELRFPIYKFLGGALFYDVGNVFESLSAIPSSKFENDFGFGISVKTPVGPVRIDIAYNPNPPNVRQYSENPGNVEGYSRWNIHFNIGNPF